MRDGLLGNRKAELVLEIEEELHETERVDSKLVDGRVHVDRVDLAAELRGGKILDSLQCVHWLARSAVGGRPRANHILSHMSAVSRERKLPFMSPFSLLTMAALLATLQAAPYPQNDPRSSPVGFWNAISDVKAAPNAVVEIREAHGELYGIVRQLLVAADHDDSLCLKCSDERKAQPIVGMEIIRHMHRDGNEWAGGEILDPENGKTYRARMKLIDNGAKLVVRGYLGISLFGRSETWTRR